MPFNAYIHAIKPYVNIAIQLVVLILQVRHFIAQMRFFF